jgi:hypothetical protein
MLKRHAARRAYKAVSVIQGIFAFSAVVLSAFLKANPTKAASIDPLLGGVVATVQPLLWIALPIATGGSVALAALKRRIGEPWFWEAVHSFLDIFRSQVFVGFAADPEHHHRVTLFRRRTFCLTTAGAPWTGWVVTVERSGHTTQDSEAIFRASDNPDKNEGVAGVAWGFRRPVPVIGLPEFESLQAEADIQSYAQQTYVSVAWAKEHKPQSRSLLAIPIEVKNELWGVLVLDSRRPDGIAHVRPEDYTPFAKILGKFLERA